MDTNAKALLIQVQLGFPLIKGRKGKIVAISSIGAERAVQNYAAIGASKAALVSLVRHLAAELGPYGINVNAISAGMVDTEALQHMPHKKVIQGWVRARSPMRRLTTAKDIANAAVFLCSDQAEMIQGHTLIVDGGSSIKA
jgi:enoyl-[acyl-carrier protein] reductase III